MSGPEGMLAAVLAEGLHVALITVTRGQFLLITYRVQVSCEIFAFLYCLLGTSILSSRFVLRMKEVSCPVGPQALLWEDSV